LRREKMNKIQSDRTSDKRAGRLPLVIQRSEQNEITIESKSSEQKMTENTFKTDFASE
jgi:hypothetical protein